MTMCCHDTNPKRKRGKTPARACEGKRRPSLARENAGPRLRGKTPALACEGKRRPSLALRVSVRDKNWPSYCCADAKSEGMDRSGVSVAESGPQPTART